MADIVQIAEKSIPFQYRGYKAQLTYVRATKRWHWEFENILVTHFSGDAKTIDDARKEVKKHVDTIIGPGAA